MMRGPDTHEEARQRLVRRLAEERIIRSPAVQNAFLAIPREAFVPAAAPSEVYADTTIPVAGEGGEWLTTSSQPTMMAIMLEQLRVQPSHRVLEIGAGTGYNAALLSHLAGPDGSVDSVEIEPEAVASATRTLAEIGSTARAHHGDGADGWPGAAPYDRIIATVAVWDIPSTWTQQSAAGARIVAPLTIMGGDYSVALIRDGEDWVSESIEPCAFVRFKGRMAYPEEHLTHGDRDDPTLTLRAEMGKLPPKEYLRRWLNEGEGEPIRGLNGRDAWDALALWIIHEREAENVVTAVSYSHGLGWQGRALGVWDEDGITFMAPNGRLEHFGGGESLDVLRNMMADWCGAGVPGLDRLRLRLYPGTVTEPGWMPRWSHSLRVEVT